MGKTNVGILRYAQNDKPFIFGCSLLVRRYGLPLLLAAVACVQVPAQTFPSSALATQSQPASAESDTDLLVDTLVENATVNRATLPSLAAHESIVSKVDEVVFFGKSVYKAEAAVRMVRKSTGGPMEESRQIMVLNGKAIAPNEQARLPFDFVDDFDDFQTEFFSPQHRRCYNFALVPHANRSAPLELSITPRADAAAQLPCALAQKGLAGMVRIDPSADQLTHLEFTLPVAAAEPIHHPTFLAADYSPAKVGNKTFWLPTTVIAHWVGGADRKTPFAWVSRYSDYHQYTASVTISPVESEPDAPPVSSQ